MMKEELSGCCSRRAHPSEREGVLLSYKDWAPPCWVRALRWGRGLGELGGRQGLAGVSCIPGPSCPSGVSWTVLVHPRAPTLVLGLVQPVGVGLQ